MGFLGSGTLIRGLVAKINPADDDCLIIGDLDNTKMRKITFGDITAAIKKKLGIADINKSISELNSSLKSKQNSLMRGTFTGNLNEEFTAGYWWCAFDNISNGPYTSGFGWLEVIRSSPSTFIQKIYRHNNGISQIVIRSYVNNQWYPWKILKTEEFIPS